jgi:hypothetical protein
MRYDNDAEVEIRSSAVQAIANMRDESHDHLSFAFLPTHELQHAHDCLSSDDVPSCGKAAGVNGMARVVTMDTDCLSDRDVPFVSREVSTCFAGGESMGRCCLSRVSPESSLLQEWDLFLEWLTWNDVAPFAQITASNMNRYLRKQASVAFVYIPISFYLLEEECRYSSHAFEPDEKEKAAVSRLGGIREQPFFEWMVSFLLDDDPPPPPTTTEDTFELERECFPVVEAQAHEQFPQILDAMHRIVLIEQRKRPVEEGRDTNNLIFCWTAAFQHPEPMQRQTFSIEIVDYSEEQRWVYDPRRTNSGRGHDINTNHDNAGQESTLVHDSMMGYINETEVRDFFRAYANGTLQAVPLPVSGGYQQSDRLKTQQLVFVTLIFVFACISCGTKNEDFVSVENEASSGCEHEHQETAVDRKGKAQSLFQSITQDKMAFLALFAMGMVYNGLNTISTLQLKIFNTCLFVGIVAHVWSGEFSWSHLRRRLLSQILVYLPTVGMVLAAGGGCCSENSGV